MSFNYEKYYKDILKNRVRSDIIQGLKKDECLDCIHKKIIMKENKNIYGNTYYVEYFGVCPFDKCCYEE